MLPLSLILSICLLGVSIPTQAQISKAVKTLPAMGRQQALAKTTYMYTRGLGSSAAKQTLNTRFIYQEEVQRASELYNRIQNAGSLRTRFTTLRKDIQENIVNHTLRKSLLTHLEAKSQSAMLQELSDYYHLAPKYIPTFNATMMPAETFAWNALLYLKNHPHKPTWALRHVLKTDGVDETLKDAIREFIKEDTIVADDHEVLLNLLRNAYEQYTRVLNDAAQAPSVVETVAIYKELADSLEVFTATYNRPPLWQNEGAERDLFNRVGTLLYTNQVNQFEAVIPQLERLFALTERFPTPRFTEQETLEEITYFMAKYNQLPQSMLLREHLTSNLNEAALYESMLYWKKQSPEFSQQLEKLIFPQKENYYPPYF